MGEFIRSRLPEPAGYYEGRGLVLKGHGKWRTTRCEFHGGSDSMRINVVSGAWRCMACGESGGDVLAYAMQRDCIDFVSAARTLGAYVDDGRPHHGPSQSVRLPARDAMEVAALELGIARVVMSDLLRGVVPSDTDWARFLVACNRVESIAMEYRT